MRRNLYKHLREKRRKSNPSPIRAGFRCEVEGRQWRGEWDQEEESISEEEKQGKRGSKSRRREFHKILC